MDLVGVYACVERVGGLIYDKKIKIVWMGEIKRMSKVAF
jgi:hypothetical protein